MRDPTSVSYRVLTPQRMSRSVGHLDMEAQQLVGYGANVRRVLAQITVSNAHPIHAFTWDINHGDSQGL